MEASMRTVEGKAAPGLLAAVTALLAKADDWKSIHESHLAAMRVAAKTESADLLPSAKAFLARVDSDGWSTHESHLAPLRSAVAQADL